MKPRIATLPPAHRPELNDQFAAMERNLGFVPDSAAVRPHDIGFEDGRVLIKAIMTSKGQGPLAPDLEHRGAAH